MTKSSNAFASQGLGSRREGKRNGGEEKVVEEGKVPVGTGRRSAVTCARYCHVVTASAFFVSGGGLVAEVLRTEY